jgi:hypothetical protein
MEFLQASQLAMQKLIMSLLAQRWIQLASDPDHTPIVAWDAMKAVTNLYP